jgi:hypothetical protein
LLFIENDYHNHEMDNSSLRLPGTLSLALLELFAGKELEKSADTGALNAEHDLPIDSED